MTASSSRLPVSSRAATLQPVRKPGSMASTRRPCLSFGGGLGLALGGGRRLPFRGGGPAQPFGGRRRGGRRRRGHGRRLGRLAQQRVAQRAQGGGTDRVGVPLQADLEGVLAL